MSFGLDRCKHLISTQYRTIAVKPFTTFAVTVLTQTFGITKEQQTERGKQINSSTTYRVSRTHPKSAVQRIRVPRSHGDWDLIDISKAI